MFAGRQPKQLNRSDFLLKFDQATSVNLSRSQLAQLLASNVRSGTQITPQVGHAIVVSKPLPVVRGAVGRQALVNQALTILKAEQVLFLVGSSGMGKSNLATLIAQNSDKDWGWCSFRAVASAMLKNGIAYLNQQLELDVLPPFLILDDVDFAKLHQFEQELTRLLFTTVERNGYLVFTAHQPVDETFLDAVWKSSQSIFTVPPFSSDEIGELMKNHGKEDGKEVAVLSRIILARTDGHPQLVHAEVRNCQAVAWQSLEIIKGENSRATEAVKLAARNKLLEIAPSEETRNLLYRLSIVHGGFNRQLAIEVASVQEKIARPGEALDQLIGPWIESVADNVFTVSPLLAGVAEKIIEPAEIARVHNKIALQVFERDIYAVMTPSEFGTLFFHAFEARNNEALFILAVAIVKEEEQFHKYMYMELYWFAFKQLGKGEHFITEHPEIDILLRLAQFILVVSSNDSHITNLVIQRTLEAAQRLDCNEPTAKMMKAYVYFQILNNVNACLPITQALELFIELMAFDVKALASVEVDEIDDIPQLPASLYAGAMVDDPVQITFFSQIERLNNFSDLSEFFDYLSDLKGNNRNTILGWLNEQNDLGYSLIQQVYLKEIENDNVDKRGLVAEFESLGCTLLTLQLMQLYTVSQSVVADIYNELLADAPTALRVLKEALEVCPASNLLYNELFKVHFKQGDISSALEFAKKAIEGGWLPVHALVCRSRDLAMVAHRAWHWDEATKYYLDCVERCKLANIPDDLLWVGLLADAGFTLWKTGEYQKSLEILKEVLLKLESIELGDDIRSWHLHATVRHCVAWVALDSENSKTEDIFEPVPGMCSSQDPVKAIKNHELKPLRLLWSMLTTAEIATNCNAGICEYVEHQSMEQLDVSQIAFENTQRFQRALKLNLFDDYVQRVHGVLVSMAFTQKVIAKEITPEKLKQLPAVQPVYWCSEDGQKQICHYLLVGCVHDFANNARLTIDLNKWAKQLKTLQMEGDLTAKLLAALSGDEFENNSYLNSANSLFLLSNKKVESFELWWMTFHLLRTFVDTKMMVEKQLSGILVKVWLLVLDDNTAKFLDPYVARMKIGMACVNPDVNGFNKLARILLIARDFLNHEFPDNVIGLLKKLKE